MEKIYFVYILTNPSHTVLYTGTTNNILRRLEEHRLKLHPNSFTAKYNCSKLVYFEVGNNPSGAIEREKIIKDMRRERKIELIESINPKWEELSSHLY